MPSRPPERTTPDVRPPDPAVVPWYSKSKFDAPLPTPLGCSGSPAPVPPRSSEHHSEAALRIARSAPTPAGQLASGARLLFEAGSVHEVGFVWNPMRSGVSA